MATKKGAKHNEKAQTTERDDYLERMEEQLSDAELETLYSWVDGIPLSRPKRNICRDFSDGVLVAEVVRHFFPNEGIVELHNYTPANATAKKMENWYYLNRKVFSKMNFELAPDVIDDLVACKPGMIEKVLLMLQVKIKRAEYARQRQSDKPEADQHRRKGVIKVGIEDTKGSKFIKAKQPPHAAKSPVKNPQSNYIAKKRVGPVVETDLVPRYIIEEKEQSILARDETIQMLKNKIAKLEYLIQLKDRRLAELNNRMGHQEPMQQHQQQQQQYRPQDDHRYYH